MKVSTQHHPDAPPASRWSAVDGDTYDADCDQDGYFSTSPQGWGATEAAAISDLKEQLYDDQSDIDEQKADADSYTAIGHAQEVE